MSHPPPADYGWYCPQCNILQPIYQRCSICETVFELHCGRVGICLRFNPVYSPLSPQGLCRNCRRLNLAGPSGGAPPPPPPSPPGGGGGGGSGPHTHQSTSGSQQQQQQQPQQNRHTGTTYRRSRKDRSQGRQIDFQESDDELLIGIGATGYGTPGDIYNGWWCIYKRGKNDKSEKLMEEVVDKSVLETSPKSIGGEKLLKSPTKKTKTDPSDKNKDDDEGEASDDDGGRKRKVPTPQK